MNLANSVYNWFSVDKINNSIKQLSDNQILNVANEINCLLSETNLVENKPELSLPQLVVVGTQSSGKSSVLNNINFSPLSFDEFFLLTRNNIKHILINV
jgi:predicted GTPase